LLLPSSGYFKSRLTGTMAALDSDKVVQMTVVASQSEKRCCGGIEQWVEQI
jgi:hypothetical protein